MARCPKCGQKMLSDPPCECESEGPQETLGAALDRLVRMEAALRPFADYWEKSRRFYLDQRKSDWIDRMPDDWPANVISDAFTVGQFRAAAKALKVYPDGETDF